MTPDSVYDLVTTAYGPKERQSIGKSIASTLMTAAKYVGSALAVYGFYTLVQKYGGKLKDKPVVGKIHDAIVKVKNKIQSMFSKYGTLKRFIQVGTIVLLAVIIADAVVAIFNRGRTVNESSTFLFEGNDTNTEGGGPEGQGPGDDDKKKKTTGAGAESKSWLKKAWEATLKTVSKVFRFFEIGDDGKIKWKGIKAMSWGDILITFIASSIIGYIFAAIIISRTKGISFRKVLAMTPSKVVEYVTTHKGTAVGIIAVVALVAAGIYLYKKKDNEESGGTGGKAPGGETQ